MTQRALTMRQTECLSLIQDSIARFGAAPTYRELSESLKIGTNAVADHLRALERKGYIARRQTEDGKPLSRSIRLLCPTQLMVPADCGQDGVCVHAPGCVRHWAERNRELVEQVNALQARWEQRAQEVVAELQERGSEAQRLSAFGFGDAPSYHSGRNEAYDRAADLVAEKLLSGAASALRVSVSVVADASLPGGAINVQVGKVELDSQ